MHILKIIAIAFLTSFFSPNNSFSEDGKSIFKTNCTACHSIGKGRLVGPDLKNINGKRSKAWLFKWIKSSQALIKSGDAEAIAIFKEYNEVPMTDFSFLSDEQIKSILTYIEEESSASATASIATNSAPAPNNQPNQQDINKTDFSFTTAGILLISLALVFLVIIFLLSRIIKKQSEEQINFYEGKRSFF